MPEVDISGYDIPSPLERLAYQAAVLNHAPDVATAREVLSAIRHTCSDLEVMVEQGAFDQTLDGNHAAAEPAVLS